MSLRPARTASRNFPARCGPEIRRRVNCKRATKPWSSQRRERRRREPRLQACRRRLADLDQATTPSRRRRRLGTWPTPHEYRSWIKMRRADRIPAISPAAAQSSHDENLSVGSAADGVAPAGGRPARAGDPASVLIRCAAAAHPPRHAETRPARRRGGSRARASFTISAGRCGSGSICRAGHGRTRAGPGDCVGNRAARAPRGCRGRPHPARLSRKSRENEQFGARQRQSSPVARRRAIDEVDASGPKR